ncbi:lipopolysaccharide biosynthesis protein [Paenibacillus herberti]|uniref:Polysaccharide biosynthesis protein C-terminal domain-containing protein n=1 Tax=Paenibacillus herberti TaxID=1619309 RepID=A0A229NV15_9BACL|nr:oligosaccharide flippase family protein [Paenibacillus herberti]OXM13718.1 hypothetical protein CGZ75_22125 [Paenibacillus herberti]
MKKLFLSSFALNMVVMALNLMTGIMIARWLGSYGRGEFAAAIRWTALLVGLSTLGLPGAVIYLGKLYKERQQELLGSYLIAGVFFGLTGMGIGWLIMPLLMEGQPAELVLYARIAMICLPFSVMTDGLIGTLQSLNLFRKVMLLRLMSPLGSLLVILILQVSGHLSVRNLILYQIVIWGLFTFILTMSWVFRQVKPSLKNLHLNLSELMRNGIKIYGGSLVAVFGGNFDQLILSLLLAPYALGLYTVAGSIGGILPSVLFGALNVFLWPKLMDLKGEEKKKKTEQMHSMMLLLCTLVTLVACACAPVLLPLLYGNEYKPAIWMAIILLAVAPIRICSQLLLYYLNTEGKFNTVTLSELLSVGGGMGIMLLLMPYLGAIAAAIGIAGGSVLKWIVYIVILRSRGVNTKKLFTLHKRDISYMASTIKSLLNARWGKARQLEN